MRSRTSLSSLATLALPLASGVSGAVIRRAAVPSGVPSFAVDYAPLVYLHSTDPFRPSDIGAQISHTKPAINLTAVKNPPTLDLNNLDQLNKIDNSDSGNNIYLTATDYIDFPSKLPDWVKGVKPDSNGVTKDTTGCAVIVNSHPDGATVDVFYMHFYAYNYGGVVFGQNLDDHVGDWEHNMVRFKDGKPTAVWYSQHAFGQAFAYDALDKDSKGRPYAYSANGSHALYAKAGSHDHTLQIFNLPDNFGVLEDVTDKGPLWDPLGNAYFYSYDADKQTFTAYDKNTPVNWLNFKGKWGDDRYDKSDPRQKNFFNLGIEYKYDAGPTGPYDKTLNRTDVCPPKYPCVVYPTIIA